MDLVRPDFLRGAAGNDLIEGGLGGDFVEAGDGSDIVLGQGVVVMLFVLATGMI